MNSDIDIFCSQAASRHTLASVGVTFVASRTVGRSPLRFIGKKYKGSEVTTLCEVTRWYSSYSVLGAGLSLLSRSISSAM